MGPIMLKEPYMVLLALLFVLSGCTAYLRPFTTQSSHFSACGKNLMNMNINDPLLEQYLKGSINSPWKGTRESLSRRKQAPRTDYSPNDVVKICLSALQTNDDPQLDHGCCVLLEFKSPNGPLSKSGLDPAGYGRFLRSSEYSLLVEHDSVEFLPSVPTELNDLYIQKVQLTGYSMADLQPRSKIFQFYLSKVDDLWLVDVVLLQNET